MKKFLISLYVSFCIIFVLTNVCYGYLDPSAMTYLIQVMAALAIGVSTSIGIFFYKIKRKFSKKKAKKQEINNNKENDGK